MASSMASRIDVVADDARAVLASACTAFLQGRSCMWCERGHGNGPSSVLPLSTLLFPFTGRLPHGDIEAVPYIDVGDGNDQARKRRCIVISGSLAPDLVRHGVRSVAYPRERLRQCQGGAFGVGEVECLAPGCHSEEALIRFAGPLGNARVHVNAGAASVDLACA